MTFIEQNNNLIIKCDGCGIDKLFFSIESGQPKTLKHISGWFRVDCIGSFVEKHFCPECAKKKTISGVSI